MCVLGGGSQVCETCQITGSLGTIRSFLRVLHLIMRKTIIAYPKILYTSSLQIRYTLSIAVFFYIFDVVPNVTPKKHHYHYRNEFFIKGDALWQVPVVPLRDAVELTTLQRLIDVGCEWFVVS